MWNSLAPSLGFNKEVIMKTSMRINIYHLTVYVIFFIMIFLFQSCASTSTSVMRLEGNDFRENLPGLWEGKYSWGGSSKETNIKINEIDGNNVQLTGYMPGGGEWPASDEVYGHIENSYLLLTWPVSDCNWKISMKRDDSNNFTLAGNGTCSWFSGGRIQLKKIE